ncbi:hypothetical protein JXJ21_23965 [candidate division KSB1 bacterium]|nr:hypothetical protein [candidate division KSB1 bacterium]
MRKLCKKAAFGLALSGVLFLAGCQQEGLFEKTTYYYDLQVSTNSGNLPGENVTLRNAIILINGKDRDAISYVSGTYLYRIPMKDINTIQFDAQRASGRYDEPGGWDLSMKILTISNETIKADSIPNFFVRGFQTKYVERILRNDASNFDIKGIRILRQYTKYDPSRQQGSQSSSEGYSGNQGEYSDTQKETQTDGSQTGSRRKTGRSRR